MQKEIINNCNNCAHFMQHYVISRHAHISTVCCGHCLDHYLNAKERRDFPNIKDCHSWQPKEIEEKKKMQSIKFAIQNISQRLDEIMLVLKDKADEV